MAGKRGENEEKEGENGGKKGGKIVGRREKRIARNGWRG